jgi:hypothetical protein
MIPSIKKYIPGIKRASSQGLILEGTFLGPNKVVDRAKRESSKGNAQAGVRQHARNQD